MMTTKSKGAAVVGACLIALAAATPFVAARASGGAQQMLSIPVSTATVDIRLSDRGLSAEGVVDDSTVSHEVEVENRGVDAWVRVRTTVSDGNGAEAPLDDPLAGMAGTPEGSPSAAEAQGTPLEGDVDDHGFVLADDGWCYLTEPVASGSSFVWRELVCDPEPMRDGAGGERDVDTVVEAVQAAYIEPDFDGADPWGGIEAPVAQYRVTSTGKGE